MGIMQKPVVIQLELDEVMLFERMCARGSPLDAEKLKDGFRGPAWMQFWAAEGCSYHWPLGWEVQRVNAASGPDAMADEAFDFLQEQLCNPGVLVLVVGDGGSGKTTLIRKLMDRRLAAIPVLGDWIKDPIKELHSRSWPERRDEVYVQIYFLVASLISWRLSVILEAPFKVEMARSPSAWCSLMEHLCSGNADLAEISRLMEPLRRLK